MDVPFLGSICRQSKASSDSWGFDFTFDLLPWAEAKSLSSWAARPAVLSSVAKRAWGLCSIEKPETRSTPLGTPLLSQGAYSVPAHS